MILLPYIRTLLTVLVALLSLRLPAEPRQFLVMNLTSHNYHEAIAEIKGKVQPNPESQVGLGVAAIFSYFAQPRAQVEARLRELLQAAVDTGTPLVVQLDGENWWSARPELWNWWDPSKPGYSESNRFNVEWTGWSPENAIRLAWRNWGRQLRVLPPPNLMSPRYRAACHEEMQALIPVLLEWWRTLPPAKSNLFIGLKLGWESSIGVNAWHYPNGDAFYDQPPEKDPVYGLTATNVPSRGVAQLGYAAVKTAGLKRSGQISESDLAEVVRRHLEDLCRQASVIGVPRDRLFTHTAAWKERELLYAAATNRYSCPGWSFYHYAANPALDRGVQQVLQLSDAPYWAAVEWLYQGPNEINGWRQALERSFTDPKCRYVCIYNWEGINQNLSALEGIREFLRKSTRQKPKEGTRQ